MALRRITMPLLLAAALAAPASASAQKPADVTRIEAAVVELANLKRGSAAQTGVAGRSREAEAALRRCRSKGRGWKRIRKVGDRSQRNAYARGAKQLWADLREVAVEGAWVEVYAAYFDRFLRRFDTPLSDPLLQAGIEAQRKRLAYNQAAYSFGSCATFERLLKKVREFKVGGRHGVAGDYYAGRIYNVFVGYVADTQRAAARKHWGSSQDRALETARDRLKELGGDEGYANYFAFAFRG